MSQTPNPMERKVLRYEVPNTNLKLAVELAPEVQYLPGHEQEKVTRYAYKLMKAHAKYLTGEGDND